MTSRRSFVRAALLALFVATRGQAESEEELGTCRTVTQRSYEEVVPFLSNAPNTPRRGIEIRPGETLCVTGDLVELHPVASLEGFDTRMTTLESLRIADVAPSGSRVVEVTLGDREEDGTSRLRVSQRLLSGSRLSLRMFVPLGDFEYKVAEPRPLLVGAEPTTITFSDAPEAVLLAGFLVSEIVEPSPPPPSPDPFRALVRDGGTVMLGFAFAGGVRQFDLTTLDRALAENGYEPTSHSAPAGAGLATLGMYRFRLDLSAHVGGLGNMRHTEGQESSAWFGEFGADLGYEILRHRLFSVFPFVGVRTIGVRLSVPRGVPPFQADRLGSFDLRRTIEKSTTHLSVGLGLEQVLWPKYAQPWLVGLTVGTRITYSKQIHEDPWELTHEYLDERYGDAPHIDASGASVLFTVGAAGHAVPER